jgi:hypothetical protein
MMRFSGRLLLVVLVAIFIPTVASACERCLNGQCIGPFYGEGGYCLNVYPDDCTFEPTFDCCPLCCPSSFCLSPGKDRRRAGEKRVSAQPLYEQWQIASVTVNGKSTGTKSVSVARLVPPSDQRQ